MTHLAKSPETSAVPVDPPKAQDPDAPVNDRDNLMRWLPFLSTPVLLIILIGGWQFAVSVIGVSEFILPAPADVARALGALVTSGTFWHDLWIPFYEVLVGFLVALIVGTAVGVVLGRVLWLERALQPAL